MKPAKCAVILWLVATTGQVLAHDMNSLEWKAFGQPGKAGAAARTISITASGMRYSLKAVDVKLGETIRFVVTNRAPVKHEFVIGSRSFHAHHITEMAAMPDMVMDEANTIDLKPGETKTLYWQFTKAGEFQFGCDIPGHYQAGMVGKLLVR